MTTVSLAPRTASSAWATAWQQKVWNALRFMAIAGFVLLAIVVPLQGHKHSSYDHLLNRLHSGAVHDVTVYDNLLAPGEGYAHPTIVWKDGWLTRESTVLQVTSASELSQVSDYSGGEHVVGDLAAALRQEAPGLRVHQASGSHGMSASMLGWSVPTWAAIMPVVLLLLTLGLIQGGPEPRFATRWGWAWFVLSPVFPVAALGYLLFAPGSQPDDAQRRQTRRITGGWAFAIVLFCLGGLGPSRG